MEPRWLIVALIALATAALAVFLARKAGERRGPVEVNWVIEREGDLEGWRMLNGLAPAKLTEDGLTTEVTGFDPYMLAPPLRVDADRQKVVVVGMRVRGSATALRIYWVREDSPNWGEDKAFSWPIAADGEFREYVVVVNHPEWRGTVTAVRFDLEPPDCYGTYWAIKYVRIPARAEVRLEGVSLTKAVVAEGDQLELRVRLRNLGAEAARVELGVEASENLAVEARGAAEIGPASEGVATLRVTALRSGVARLKVRARGAKRSLEFPVYRREVLEFSPKIGAEGVHRLERGYAVVSGQAALIVPESGGLYGPLIVALRGPSGWEPVGSLHVELRALGDGVEAFVAAPQRAWLAEGALKLAWEGSDSGGGAWRVEFSAKPLDGGLIALEAELGGKGELLHFSIVVRAGEPGFSASKSEALFPGLEWLEGDERSSSSLVVPKPHDLRVAPNPIKVTVPLMAVRRDEALVALMWDPLQPWGGGSPPAPAFASPNFVEGQENHLLKLFVPPASTVEENREEGAPLKLANGAVKLSALLYAARAGSVLEAARKWVEVFGLPEPALPRSMEEELRLCAKAYLETMWVPGKGWPHAVPGWEPEPYPGYAHVLLLISYVERDAALRAATIARARETLALAEAKWGTGALISGAGCHILTPQLPFLVARLEQGLALWREHATQLIAAQGPDGEWGFQPSAAPCGMEVARKLGEPGAREVGITATYAAEVLRYARVTGDAAALRAGLRALKAMERYRVPRGAQTWEVPIRAPDLLAAAKALEAYLEAYIATGEEGYLERAKYWALAGLPFVYLWGLPDRPMMVGATIPVYASSCLQGPGWFGTPVQWNGLVYAYHLLRLSAHDGSFPWRELATLILASAMRQQVTRGARRKPVGSYPDSWNLVADRDQPPYINPEGLAKVALVLAGVNPDLNTVRVGGIVASTPAHVLSAELSGGELRLRLKWPYEGPVHVLINTPALDVWKGRERLPRVEDLDAAAEGWKVSPLLNATIVKVAPSEAGELRLALGG